MNNPDTMAHAALAAAPARAEVAAAEKAIHAILGGLKNYSVFAPEHASTLVLIQGVQQTIGRFTEKYGDLSFEVERQRVLYREKPVFEGEGLDDNPVFVLHRDGIRWLDFLAGVQDFELANFFRIYNHYRVIPDDPEDDLVTALWRAEFTHIYYEASYELWDSEPAMDLALFEPAAPDPPAATVAGAVDGWESVRPDSSHDDYQKMSLGLAEGGPEFWNLTPDEQQALVLMIDEERTYDNNEAAIRLMFLVLRSEDEPQIYESIVDYLREEFRSALGGRNFRRAYLVLDNMQKIGTLQTAAKPWSVAIHERFLADIIRPEMLETLLVVWPLLSTMEATELKTFIALLQLLPTSAGVTMASMLARIDAKPARSLIVEIIASYATRDPGVLAVLLSRPEDDLVLRLVRVLRDLPDREVVGRLLRHVTEHSSPKIRQETLRIMGRQELY